MAADPTSYAEREQQARYTRIVSAAIGDRVRCEGAQPPPGCYRCGATGGLVSPELCRSCYLAIDAVLKPLDIVERQIRAARVQPRPIGELRGALAGITGDMGSAEYIAELRGR